MCSNRWAKPVRPFGSMRKPMLYMTSTSTTGALRSSLTTTFRPLGSVKYSTGTLNAEGLGGRRRRLSGGSGTGDAQQHTGSEDQRGSPKRRSKSQYIHRVKSFTGQADEARGWRVSAGSPPENLGRTKGGVARISASGQWPVQSGADPLHFALRLPLPLH